MKIPAEVKVQRVIAGLKEDYSSKTAQLLLLYIIPKTHPFFMRR